MATKETYITSSHDVTIDSNYANWLHALKDNYQKAQVKAAIKVNAEKLLWNWQLGRDLVLRKAEEQWGTGIVEQLSLDLQAAFPNEKGFSSRNLWTMKQWYLFYSEKLKQPVSELISTDYYADIKLKQVATEIHEEVNEGMPFPDIFAYVPWGHHTEILKKCHSVEEALYYIHCTIEEGWSRQTLMNCLKADRYHKAGNAVSNFTEQLPKQQAQLAQEITKDNYDFGVITLYEKITGLTSMLEKSSLSETEAKWCGNIDGYCYFLGFFANLANYYLGFSSKRLKNVVIKHFIDRFFCHVK